MQFTQTPSDYAPLGGPLVYAFSDAAPRTFDLSVVDLNLEAPVGAKRFCDLSAGTFDAAPYLRRRVSFRPEPGATGFVVPWDRTVPAVVEIDGIRTPARNFLPRDTAVAAPALLTTVPRQRLVVRGACEEFTLLTDTPATATVEAFRDGETVATGYTASRAGLVLFRLDTADFPEADILTVQFDRFSRVVCQIAAPFGDGCRLAWRSSAGSLEHYTFPVVKEERVETQRTRLQTETGCVAGDVRSWRLLTLLSAYEPAQMLAALAGILSSPQVWLVAECAYTPVEPMTDAAGIRRHGTLRNLELQIRMPCN